jgi:hypothetical protein
MPLLLHIALEMIFSLMHKFLPAFIVYFGFLVCHCAKIILNSSKKKKTKVDLKSLIFFSKNSLTLRCSWSLCMRIFSNFHVKFSLIVLCEEVQIKISLDMKMKQLISMLLCLESRLRFIVDVRENSAVVSMSIHQIYVIIIIIDLHCNLNCRSLIFDLDKIKIIKVFSVHRDLMI